MLPTGAKGVNDSRSVDLIRGRRGRPEDLGESSGRADGGNSGQAQYGGGSEAAREDADRRRAAERHREVQGRHLQLRKTHRGACSHHGGVAEWLRSCFQIAYWW